MNKINKLFEVDFVRQLFSEKLLTLYPDTKSLGRIKIKPYKKFIWKTTYHVVLSFSVEFILKTDKVRKTNIICSAHSNESRDIAFETLGYLWRRRLGKGMVLPRPLFYYPEMGGFFYRALNGKDLYHYILKKDKEIVVDLVAKSGILFARLHCLSLKNSLPKLDEKNNRISTVIPGFKKIVSEVESRYGEKIKEKIALPYYNCIKIEEEYLNKNPNLCLVHGDAHTENIIRVSKRKTGLIDFTDFALTDFARDVGTFMQQLAYKLEIGFYKDYEFIINMKKLFLNEYLKESGQELTEDLQKRLNNYYNWTALRTAAYWLLKSKPEIERAEAIFTELNRIKNNNILAQD
jgi:thiamine kinase-like enzyme